MVIYAKKEHLDKLKEKYPASVGVIDKEVYNICNKLNNLSKEQLIMRNLWDKEIQQYIPPIADMIILSNDELEQREEDLLRTMEEERNEMIECYNKLKDLYKKYTELKPEYYTIVPIWVIGTYLHKRFLTYPYLFFNATRGSGKSRILKLTTALSKEGDMLNSLTEAVLFRTQGTLGIDEFEGITRKGGENLRELLNSAYKKGSKVKRMRKKKGIDGEEQVVEEFDVYRPILMANIWGMEEVLGDRCLTLILEKSNRNDIVNLMEVWEYEPEFAEIKQFLSEKLHLCRLCHVVTSGNIYLDWNKYLLYTNINNITTGTNNDTKLHNPLFDKLKKVNFNGRIMELCFPLIITASLIGENVVDELLDSLKGLIDEKREEQFMESKDILLTDWVSQQPEKYETELFSLSQLVREFKQFVNEDEDPEDKWLNAKWLGRALKRLNLIKTKKRNMHGRLVALDITKANEKMRMFK